MATFRTHSIFLSIALAITAASVRNVYLHIYTLSGVQTPPGDPTLYTYLNTDVGRSMILFLLTMKNQECHRRGHSCFQSVHSSFSKCSAIFSRNVRSMGIRKYGPKKATLNLGPTSILHKTLRTRITTSFSKRLRVHLCQWTRIANTRVTRVQNVHATTQVVKTWSFVFG